MENMKTVKITPWVHRELKVFIARNEGNITEFADTAILSMLATKGHKIKLPSKTKKS